ncbi:MAG: type I phosphomannose isomerase catalytic subunit [Planctomycetota bacterium]
MKLSPVVLEPRPVARPWGGRGVLRLFGWEGPPDGPTGEWWVLSTRPEAQSFVAHGPLAGVTLGELIARHGEALLGSRLMSGPSAPFPLLIKILDADDALSVQLHPSEATDPALAKTEAWLVLAASPESVLYLGLKEGVTTKSLFDAIEQNENPRSLLGARTVKSGDVAYLPAGRIHAFGAKLVALEVQQNSDTTYRLYDWHRKPGRPLHVEQARRAAAADQPSTLVVPRVLQLQPYRRIGLVGCEYFQMEALELESSVEMVSDPECCSILVPLAGKGAIVCEPHRLTWCLGAAHLLPASLGPFRLEPATAARLVRILPVKSP